MSDPGAGGEVEGGRLTQHGRKGSQATNPEPLAEKSTVATEMGQTPKSKILVNSSTDRMASVTPVPTSDPAAVSPAAQDTPRWAIEPPVTKVTLSELDVSKIIHNPKLRHDINFDPELHFRPNLDGEKGRKKQEKANAFWVNLRSQLVLFVMDRPAFDREFPVGSDWCLPMLLKSVRDIIQTLVPQQDRSFLSDGLNVDLIMQQFHHGSADLEQLASWLSGILKLHCAPMRDEWVDEMYYELSSGNRNQNVDELVKGMRSLLNILEAMKLDVANHQIRTLRPVLTEETVTFERHFFERKIKAGRLEVTKAQRWYTEAAESFRDVLDPRQQVALFGDMAAYFQGVAKFVLPSTTKDTIPNTFLFDEERILKLRADLLDTVNIEICMRIFEDLERLPRSIMVPAKPAPTSVPAYIAEDDSISLHSSSSDNSSVHVLSRPSSIVHSAYGSDASSPRSSFVSLAAPARSNASETTAKSQSVYESLMALLRTAPSGLTPTQKWAELAPSLALQMFRFTDMPLSEFPPFEQMVERSLATLHGERYAAAEHYFHDRLLAALGQRVSNMRNLSAMGLFQVATTGASRSGASSRSHAHSRAGRNPSRIGCQDSAMDSIALRLAHLGILHWRVWAPTAYLADQEMSDVE